MTPLRLCRDEFERRYPENNFWHMVDFYMTYGVVHCTADYFVAGRRALHTATAEQMRGSHDFGDAVCDTWFFAWFAGDMEKVWQAETPLEFVAFERKRAGELELQIVKTEVMRRLSLPSHG